MLWVRGNELSDVSAGNNATRLHIQPRKSFQPHIACLNIRIKWTRVNYEEVDANAAHDHGEARCV
jgi:hypothetical protein